MLNRKINNEYGITLVEVLATLVIMSIIGALAYSILFQGYNNYNRVKVETELRDEADLIMANYISDFYVMKKTEAKLVNSCTNGFINSEVSVTKSNGPSYKTGVINKDVIVRGQPVRLNNTNVKFVPIPCTTSTNLSNIANINSRDGVEFTIKFTLETTVKGRVHQMDFKNTISIIEDKL